MTEPVELRYAGPGTAKEPPIRNRWWLLVTTVLCLAATVVPVDEFSIIMGIVQRLRYGLTWSFLFDLTMILPPVALPVTWIAWLLWPSWPRMGIIPRVVAMAMAGLLGIGPFLNAFAYQWFYATIMPYVVGLIALVAVGLTLRCVYLIGRIGWRIGVLAMFLSAYCVAVMMVSAYFVLFPAWRGVVLFSFPLVAVLVELRLLWRSAARTFP